MRRVDDPARRVGRARSGRRANGARAVLAVAVSLFLAAAFVLLVHRPPAAPPPPPVPTALPTRVPVPGTPATFPQYAVTGTPEAARPCYLPVDTGAVVLDTIARAPGVVVVAVALVRDRATLSYVEARQTGADGRACLGRVARAAAGWGGYVRRVEPMLGVVDHVIADARGAGLAYPDRRAAGAAVELVAHGGVARARRGKAKP